MMQVLWIGVVSVFVVQKSNHSCFCIFSILQKFLKEKNLPHHLLFFLAVSPDSNSCTTGRTWKEAHKAEDHICQTGFLSQDARFE